MQLAVQGDYLLCISENGLGKRTKKEDFRPQTRGGKGILCYKVTKKTGRVMGARMVTDENELLIITTEGIMIRTEASGISITGRSASGVKMMNLAPGVKVASFTKVHADAVNKENE